MLRSVDNVLTFAHMNPKIGRILSFSLSYDPRGLFPNLFGRPPESRWDPTVADLSPGMGASQPRSPRGKCTSKGPTPRVRPGESSARTRRVAVLPFSYNRPAPWTVALRELRPPGSGLRRGGRAGGNPRHVGPTPLFLSL